MQSEDMQFEYDPEKLIEEVKKRPGIWDFEDADYRAKHVRHQLWNEVVHELMRSDMIVTKSEMRELELQLQKKWKSIRDCFQKYISNPQRTRRPYIYTKQLQFLLKNQELPPTIDGSSESEDLPRPRAKRVWKTKRTLKLANLETQQSSDEDNDNDNTVNQDEYLEYSNEPTDIEVPTKIARTIKTDEFAFASVDVPTKSDDDSDKMFLLSLLPHIKSIPEEFRLNVKMDLMQVLKNANYMCTRDHKIL